MSEFLDTLTTAPLLADGAMGSYLFARTGRLSEANHVYEALCLHQPELIREVHFAYLQAGTRCLTTNTFGANHTHMDPLGEGQHIEQLNRAGVNLARQAISAFRTQTRQEGPYFVLGSVGPTFAGRESPREIKEVYREQIQALIAEGVDALLLETFSFLPHVMALLDLVGEFANPPPLIIQMALHQTGNGWDQDPLVFAKTAADMGAKVIGANCCSPWEATAFFDAVQELDAVKEGELLLAAMPNAGGFQRIGHRYMTGVNPEFMGKLARTFAARGVHLLGGCCEVHPDHINEMHNYLQGRQTGSHTSNTASLQAGEPAGDALKRQNGEFSRKIKEGEFAVSIELLPARGTAPRTLQSKIDFVGALAASGQADALDITDGSRGIPLMPPGDFIALLRHHLNWTPASGDSLELIPHFTTRDLNVMGLQSRLVGYWANRIHNILFITGDPPKMSPTYPRSTAVFDFDSTTLIRYTHSCLNAGVDFGGRPLGQHAEPRTRFTIGTGFAPEALNAENEIEKLRHKVGAGADYVLTQPAFSFAPLAVLESFRSQVPVLIGVMVATSLDHARRIGQVPGVVVPQTIYDRLGKYENPEDQAREGREIAIEQVRWIKEQDWAGLYLMSPASHQPIIEILESGLS